MKKCIIHVEKNNVKCLNSLNLFLIFWCPCSCSCAKPILWSVWWVILCCRYPQHQIHSFLIHSFMVKKREGSLPLWRLQNPGGGRGSETTHKQTIREGDGKMTGVWAKGWAFSRYMLVEGASDNSSRQEASLQTFILPRVPVPSPESPAERDFMQLS